jgi:hypothetical protein
MRFCLSDKNTIAFFNGISSFIIPRPKQIIKRETPENQGKTPSFPPTSCPEPAGQGEMD